MTNTFRLFWRLFFYGILAVQLMGFPATEPWHHIILTLALCMGFYKSEALINHKGQALGLMLYAFEWSLLVFLISAHSTILVVVSAVLLAEWCWIGAATLKAKVYGSIFFLALELGYLSLTSQAMGIGMEMEMGTAMQVWLLCAVILWLGLILNDMQSKKLEAQKYYDQLRISEIALKKANLELEAYYETLEEVTILRERNRISRDIHDNVGHALATTLIQLQAIEHRMNAKQDPDAGIVKTLSDFVRSSLATTRQIVRDMVPKMLSSKKFKMDLTELCNQSSKMTGLQVLLTMPETDMTLKEGQHECLFQCVKEGLTNAMKYSQGRSVRVILTAFDASVCLTISDDGVGTDAIKPSFGLETMRSRIKAINGDFLIESAPDKGFTIKVTLPREA